MGGAAQRSRAGPSTKERPVWQVGAGGSQCTPRQGYTCHRAPTANHAIGGGQEGGRVGGQSERWAASGEWTGATALRAVVAARAVVGERWPPPTNDTTFMAWSGGGSPAAPLWEPCLARGTVGGVVRAGGKGGGGTTEEVWVRSSRRPRGGGAGGELGGNWGGAEGELGGSRRRPGSLCFLGGMEPRGTGGDGGEPVKMAANGSLAVSGARPLPSRAGGAGAGGGGRGVLYWTMAAGGGGLMADGVSRTSGDGGWGGGEAVPA